MNRTFELHFFKTKLGYELIETKFASFEGQTLKCVRGKTAGAFRGSGCFQWTAAVKGIASLNLRYLIAQSAPSVSKMISGQHASQAVSLDYALAKAPCWILDMFGVFQNGRPTARRLFLVTNPHQKRPGPVTIAINEAALSPSNIQVFVDGGVTTDPSELMDILRDVEAEPYQLPESRPCAKLKLAS